MSRNRAWNRVLLGALALTACGGGGGSAPQRPDALEERQGLVPVFDSASTTPTRNPSTSTTEPGASVTTTSAPRATAPEQEDPQATITDPVGDVTRTVGSNPGWADLAGAQLTRHDQYLELRVRFGDAAPRASGSSDRTMNVAMFVDVDGDGQVDYEVWANLADGGWDASWFDDRTGDVAFSGDAAIDVLVDGAELVVRFPPQYVGGARTFRWSLASEYGTYALLGTSQSARDDAPDDDQAVPFPG